MDEALYRAFADVEDRHWWFVARRRIVQDVIERGLRLFPGASILDIGCGTGGVLASLSGRYDVAGTDMSPLAVDHCRTRGLKKVHCGALADMPFRDRPFDLALLLDVIEHVDDDVALLREAGELVKPGGAVVVTVPAYPWMWTHHDEANHHRRRYTATTFRSSLTRAGFQMRSLSYYNTILFPLALVQRMAAGLLHSTKVAGLSVPPAPVNAILRVLFASERLLLRFMRLPFGLSLIAVAERPA